MFTVNVNKKYAPWTTNILTFYVHIINATVTMFHYLHRVMILFNLSLFASLYCCLNYINIYSYIFKICIYDWLFLLCSSYYYFTCAIDSRPGSNRFCCQNDATNFTTVSVRSAPIEILRIFVCAKGKWLKNYKRKPNVVVLRIIWQTMC